MYSVWSPPLSRLSTWRFPRMYQDSRVSLRCRLDSNVNIEALSQSIWWCLFPCMFSKYRCIEISRFNHWAVVEVCKTHKYWNHISSLQRSNVCKHNSAPSISSVCPCEEGVLFSRTLPILVMVRLLELNAITPQWTPLLQQKQAWTSLLLAEVC